MWIWAILAAKLWIFANRGFWATISRVDAGQPDFRPLSRPGGLSQVLIEVNLKV